MARHGTTWFGVLEYERLVGWAWASDLPSGGSLVDVEARPFRVELRDDATLRQALDAIVNTRNNVAVVTDGERYLGMLFVDRLAAVLL